MSSALNGSIALQRFERGNTVKMCDRIMFDFYLGLPHMSMHQRGVKIVDNDWSSCSSQLLTLLVSMTTVQTTL